MSAPAVYSGEMFFVDDGERIEVSRLIVRPDELSVEMSMPAPGGGDWFFDEKAKLIEPGTFVGRFVAAQTFGGSRIPDSESEAAVFLFKIKELSSSRLRVDGQLSADGEISHFGGVLTRYVPKP